MGRNASVLLMSSCLKVGRSRIYRCLTRKYDIYIPCMVLLSGQAVNKRVTTSIPVSPPTENTLFQQKRGFVADANRRRLHGAWDYLLKMSRNRSEIRSVLRSPQCKRLSHLTRVMLSRQRNWSTTTKQVACMQPVPLLQSTLETTPGL